MLVVWFDYNNFRFYIKFYSHYSDKKVGFINNYGHEVIQMYKYNNHLKKFVKCSSFVDYYLKYDTYDKKLSLKDKIINLFNGW